MHLCVQNNHALIAEILSKYGASFSSTSRAGCSSAEGHSGQVNIVKFLSKHEVEIDIALTLSVIKSSTV